MTARRSCMVLALVAALVAAPLPAQQEGVPVGDVQVDLGGPLPAGKSISIFFDVTVDDPIPAGVEQVANQGTVSFANLPDLLTDDPDTGTSDDPTVTPVDAEPDLSIVKTDGDASVVPGGVVVYTLNFANVGNQGATGVVVSETVPTHTTFNEAASGGAGVWSCADGAPAGTVCEHLVGALAGGGGAGSVSFGVTLVSPAPAGLDQISNTATIADDGSNGADPDPSNNSSTDTTPVDAEPDMTIGKTDGDVTVEPGNTISYQLPYDNVGNQDATGVVISETVPADTTFNAGASTPGWSCSHGDPAGTVCTFAVGAVGVGGGGSVVFAVDVIPVVPAGVEEISNGASIADDGTNGPDQNPEDNTAFDTTPVDAAPEYGIAKDDGGITTVPGNTVAYTLDYSNDGNQDGTGVKIVETVPANTTFDAGASLTGWSCADGAPAGTICEFTIGSLAGGGTGGSATFAVQVDLPVPAGFEEVDNTASIEDDTENGPDPDPSDNEASDTTPVEAVPDLGIEKTALGTFPAPGESLFYELAYRNLGKGNQGATGVFLADTVPVATTAGTNPGWEVAPVGSGTPCDGSPAGTVCVFDIGLLPSGDSGTEIFEVVVDDPLPPGTTEIVNVASIEDDGTNGADANPTDNTDTETTIADTVPPQVENIDSESDTGDGSVDECEETRVGILRLIVEFGEDMFDPPGDDDPNDVTNPDNYLLVAAGDDQDLDTTLCGPPIGDDVRVPIRTALWDEEGEAAILEIEDGLTSAPYRLLVCPTLRDLAGNSLDGDGDGSGGDEFVRTFRSEFSNLLLNGQFDCDLNAWTTVSTIPAEVAWDADDVDGAGISGSVRMTNLSGSSAFELGQCIPEAIPKELEWGLSLKIGDLVGEVLILRLSCQHHASLDCSGTAIPDRVFTKTLESTGGLWLPFSVGVLGPGPGFSTLCTAEVTKVDGGFFEVSIDRAHLSADAIFADGFESGDTAAWSSTVP